MIIINSSIITMSLFSNSVFVTEVYLLYNGITYRVLVDKYANCFFLSTFKIITIMALSAQNWSFLIFTTSSGFGPHQGLKAISEDLSSTNISITSEEQPCYPENESGYVNHSVLNISLWPGHSCNNFKAIKAWNSKQESRNKHNEPSR